MKNCDFLTEASLGEFLNIYLSTGNWISQYKIPGTRFKVDFVSESLKTWVEFDGYQHYTSSKQILSDERKDKLCHNLGFKMIRIPYFIQLSKETIKLLFNLNIPDFIQKYPHGFISNKTTMIYPADFCYLGIERFKKDLEKFNCIKDKITESLKSKKADSLSILPEPLVYLLK